MCKCCTEIDAVLTTIQFSILFAKLTVAVGPGLRSIRLARLLPVVACNLASHRGGGVVDSQGSDWQISTDETTGQ